MLYAVYSMPNLLPTIFPMAVVFVTVAVLAYLGWTIITHH